MATLAAQIGPNGISAPDYADIFRQLQNAFWSIYGTDADLDADSQDGQLIGVFAQAIYDANQLAIATYNAYSPSTAQGAGLASIVKINGLTKQVPSNSEAVVTISGQTGRVINGGVVGDSLKLNTQWELPGTVTIPDSGTIDVTATCTQPGAVTAAAGSLTVILTPTLGWQSVTNAAEAAPGQPVESDAALRSRQSQSTALPALAITEAMYAALAAVPAVSRLQIYENPGDVPDDDGIPEHSISVVVLGGDVQTIANTIALSKTPGTGTYGSISELVIDQNGAPSTINFYELAIVSLSVHVTIKALPGYNSAIGDALKASVVAFLNGLTIGEDSYLARLYSPANMGGVGDGATYFVTAITQARDGGSLLPADVVIAFNEAGSCALADVSLTVT